MEGPARREEPDEVGERPWPSWPRSSGLVPREQISERLCQQIVEVSVPQVAEQFRAGMFKWSQKEEWLDGFAPACELHNAFCVVVPSLLFTEEERSCDSSDIHAVNLHARAGAVLRITKEGVPKK